ncbi:MAG TPA: VOC family protein [Acetobacteraceae bacterium]|nr:VOC family protein [Acetobacteraceae bacterium]
MISGLHHPARPCRDSEATRRFYEELLGLPLVAAWRVGGAAGRPPRGLRTEYSLPDGNRLVFIEAPDSPAPTGQRRDPGPPLALETDERTLDGLLEHAWSLGIEVRGPVPRDGSHAIQLRDPDGSVVEVIARRAADDAGREENATAARAALRLWQAERRLARAA